jgi:hypothetical protein
LPFQLQDPERLRRDLAAVGLKDVKVETITEELQFHSGKQLWDWLTSSNPIVGTVLAELNLTKEQGALVRQALDHMVRERAGKRGPRHPHQPHQHRHRDEVTDDGEWRPDARPMINR